MIFVMMNQIFLKENLRYLVLTCMDLISLILGTWFSLMLGTQIRSLKHLKKPWKNVYIGNKYLQLCMSGFPRSIESIEKVLNFKIGFQDLEKYW